MRDTGPGNHRCEPRHNRSECNREEGAEACDSVQADPSSDERSKDYWRRHYRCDVEQIYP